MSLIILSHPLEIDPRRVASGDEYGAALKVCEMIEVRQHLH